MQQTRLMRSETDKMIAGVCGGVAAYLGVDPVLVRLAFVVLSLASGVGLAMYIILWIVMPTESRVPPEIRIMDEGTASNPSAYKTKLGQPATIGIILILLGVFLTLSQWGWAPTFIWPLVLIGAGLFYLIRRAR